MRLAALAIATLALPSLASARPITAGVTMGETQSKADAGSDPNGTIGLYGRFGMTPRVSGQLELQRIKTDSSGVDIRTGTALLVVDLGSGGHLMPVILAGIGRDQASTSYGSDTGATHIEGGFGLEYRADGGFTIGVDVRMGGRSLDAQPLEAYPATGVALYAPSTLQDGEYRSARLTAGIRF